MSPMTIHPNPAAYEAAAAVWRDIGEYVEQWWKREDSRKAQQARHDGAEGAD